eukprot:5831209-Pleurochrysis_carterae.AAC.1
MRAIYPSAHCQWLADMVLVIAHGTITLSRLEKQQLPHSGPSTNDARTKKYVFFDLKLTQILTNSNIISAVPVAGRRSIFYAVTTYGNALTG